MISVRPCPTWQYHRLAVASRYRLPASSHTKTPLPRLITSSAPSTAPMLANGCHRDVMAAGYGTERCRVPEPGLEGRARSRWRECRTLTRCGRVGIGDDLAKAARVVQAAAASSAGTARESLTAKIVWSPRRS